MFEYMTFMQQYRHEQYQQQQWSYYSHCFRKGIVATLKNLAERVEHASQVAEQRRQLLEMDDHLLRDIGINRAEAVRLANER